MAEKLGAQAVHNNHGRAAEQSYYRVRVHGPRHSQHEFGRKAALPVLMLILVWRLRWPLI